MENEGIIFICVNCGDKATCGSMKHPYCKECFQKIFDNDIDKYFRMVEHAR